MNDYQIIHPSSAGAYWKELFEYASPYASIGSYVLKSLSVFSNYGHDTAVKMFFQELDGISAQFQQLQESISSKLADPTVKELSKRMIDVKETFEEYRKVQSVGFLDVAIAQSSKIKREIVAFLSDNQTPPGYRYTYSTLMNILISLRAACRFSYNWPHVDIYPLICKELQEQIGTKDREINAARTVGSNRVSNIFRQADSEPASHISIFSFQVDGQVVYEMPFNVNGKEDWDHANAETGKEQAKWQKKCADQVSQNILEYYADLEATAQVVCG